MKNGFLKSFCLAAFFSAGCIDGASTNNIQKSRFPLQTSGATATRMVADKSPLTHMVLRTTPFYKQGPQQPWPADGNWEIGVRVRIIEHAGSYAQVESEDGIRAYVATADLTAI